MPWETIHDEEAAARAAAKADAARIAAFRERDNATLASMVETPEKDDSELTAEPPGPREQWPIAFMPEGEDVLGNGCVLKRIVTPGIADIGKPPSPGGRCKVAYTARTMDFTAWDQSDGSCAFRLGMLWVSRFLEVAAASMTWGERAAFVCTHVYAKENNATRASMPDGACFRFEVSMLSWRAPQLRDADASGAKKSDASNEELLEQVAALKAEAAPLVKHGLHEHAADIYRDCAAYIHNPDDRPDGFEPPEGREEEAMSLLVSVWLNEAMCLLKKAGAPLEIPELRRVEELCTQALSTEQGHYSLGFERDATGSKEPEASIICNAPDASVARRAKALYRRGIARTQLADYAEAHADLLAAAKLDSKSRDVRDALAALKERQAASKKKETRRAKVMLDKPGPRAAPGGGLRPVATLWMDVAVGDELAYTCQKESCLQGRLVIEMIKHDNEAHAIAPLTAENFRCLCTGERGVGAQGKPLHYKGTKFFRMIPGYLLQGGDITLDNGRGGDSIYGGRFDDECFLAKHDRPGLLSMANGGPHTNTSQFFITLCAAPELDGKYVVFGRVVSGMELLEQLQQTPVDARDRPKTPIVIRDCGEIGTSLPPGGEAPAQEPTYTVRVD